MSRRLFAHAGRLAGLYAGLDWSATALGSPASWSPTLQRSIGLVLDTGFPASLFWGPEFVLAYNEAFVALIADKHPAALGAPAREVFAEAWEQIGPLMSGVRAGTGAIWIQDDLVPLRRDGSIQQAYFTFSYSPVRNDRGEIEGVMDIATETTRQVVDRRRLLLLGRLREALAAVDGLDGFTRRITPVLREDREDLPGIAFRGVDAAGPDELLAARDGTVVELPLSFTGAGDRAAMLVQVNRQLEQDDSYRPFLELVADAVCQALDRAVLGERERRRAQQERRMSETLQHALLTRAPLPEAHPRVAVRYLPAATGAEVGGDWHDAFALGDGELALVIGDVTGHDRDAAAAMGQIRSLLRGIATSVPDSPDRILAQLDTAMANLGIDTLASVILATLTVGEGPSRLRWSNGGHPPPCLIAAADGTAELLSARPDPLLGVARDLPRHVHEITLSPGATLVLYTDGLVERRDAPLDEGFRWLCDLVAGHAGSDPQAIADAILGELDGSLEDDVALLVVTV